jgi:hypothetical protein
MDQAENVDRRVLRGLSIVTLSIIFAVAFYNPRLVSFRAFGASEFAQLMLPLLMLSLFIERVLEVFLTSWRVHRSAHLEARAELGKAKRNDAEAPYPDEEAHTQHRGQTRRIAFFAGTTLGVRVAALGIRVLEMFVDPAVFVHSRMSTNVSSEQPTSSFPARYSAEGRTRCTSWCWCLRISWGRRRGVRRVAMWVNRPAVR